MFKSTDDLRIKALRPLISPAIVAEQLPLTAVPAHTVTLARREASKIIQGRDDRLLVVVGPCSIHDPKAALEYAEKLLKIKNKLQEDLCIIMRVYFEKPRTTIGWKGLINDPKLDDSFAINQGLVIARELLLKINTLGVPAGTEFLETIIPQYISDLIAWGAIGARTTESQIHRELVSGLSMPVGFKNGTSGDVQIAIDAIHASRHHHHFLGVTKDGIPAIIATKGNKDCHIILRGASHHTNYDEASIKAATRLLAKEKLPQRLMIDCSHGNSQKDHTKQALVINSLCKQIEAGNKAICGIMLESNLVAGKQTLSHTPLVYGQSITDACIDWDETVKLLNQLSAAVRHRRTLNKGLKKH